MSNGEGISGLISGIGDVLADPLELWEAVPDTVKTTVYIGGTLLLASAVAVTMLCRRRTATLVSVLDAELLDVSFDSDIAVAYNHGEQTVQTPNWTSDDSFATAYGSSRPGVYLAGRDTTITIRIRITRSERVPETITLSGQSNDLEFRCTNCPTAEGVHTMQAQLVQPPNVIRGIFSAFAWTLTPSDNSSTVHLGSTQLELFFVLGRPLACYDEKGVWTEALRFLCLQAGLDGVGTAREATACITRYCHSNWHLVYDSANHYTYLTRGARFCLSAYLLCVDRYANCYDQAGAVTVLSHAIGSPVHYHYTPFYGFINPTNLMGVPDCNNPGYRVEGAQPKVNKDSKDRTGFGDHAFCTLDGSVFDACVGPYCGEFNIEDYLAMAIDNSPEALELLRLARDNYPNQNATAEDIVNGGIEVLDGGLAGQVVRRNLKTELEKQEIEALLDKWVLVFRDLTQKGRGDTDVPVIEDMLERQLVAMMDEHRELNEHDAVATLNREELRTLLLNHMNNEYGENVQMRPHRRGEEARREKESKVADNKEQQAKIKQCEDRKIAMKELEWTAEMFDDYEKRMDRPIYPYDPKTMDPL